MSFRIHKPNGKPLPVLISVPHCGTEFPQELQSQFKQDKAKHPDDTDWFVHDLYNFAPSLGFTMITAVYSRWVIDLNRNPDNTPLYHDGRIITALCPTTDFKGEPIYEDHRQHVDDQEVHRRLDSYYNPYHSKLRELLDEMKSKYGEVLLWDCHSIRQSVPTIQPEKFPDLILGSADERSAAKKITDLALKSLAETNLHLSHNHPFKGGYITRHYGDPPHGIHALQLEMTKVNYMDDSEIFYHSERANNIRNHLVKTLNTLVKTISS